MEKFTVEIEAKLDKAVKGVEELTDQITALKDAQEEQAESMKKQVKEIAKEQSKALKVVKGLGKGFKFVGVAMKGLGLGIILKLFGKLYEAMKQNQAVADAIQTIFAAVSMVFKEVSDRLLVVFDNVSEATGGFDALKKVLGEHSV